jgi:intracellular septation protein
VQLITDFLPVIIFFAVYRLSGDLFTATGALIAAVLAQTAVTWVRHRKVSAMALGSAAMVVVFGGLTLILKNETFIQWKPTVVNWLLAGVFLGSHFIGDRPMVERFMGEQLKLDRTSWRRLSGAWIVFFALMGVTNLVVAYTCEQATWVSFKLFGILGLTIAFVVAQGVWLSSRAQPIDEAPATPPPTEPVTEPAGPTGGGA